MIGIINIAITVVKAKDMKENSACSALYIYTCNT